MSEKISVRFNEREFALIEQCKEQLKADSAQATIRELLRIAFAALDIDDSIRKEDPRRLSNDRKGRGDDVRNTQ